MLKEPGNRSKYGAPPSPSAPFATSPSNDKMSANTQRRMALINEDRNPYFSQQHFAFLNTYTFGKIISSMDEMAYNKPDLYDDDFECMQVGHATLWAAAQIMPALFELIRRNRWQRTFATEEIFAVRDAQRKRITNQLKRPKAPYIRKRDKLCANPAPAYCDDDQALRSALLTFAEAGWLLCTDDLNFEINSEAVLTSYHEYVDRYTSDESRSQRWGHYDEFTIQLGLSPRNIEFLAYLAHTSYMDFWRMMALMNMFGKLGKEATDNDLAAIDDYGWLFELTDKQESANNNRGNSRSHSRYWIDRYVKRGWIGHHVKRTPLKDHLGPGGFMRTEVIHDRRIKADRYQTDVTWVLNPSIAVCFELTYETFMNIIKKHFDNAVELASESIDFLGIFRLRHRKHINYLKHWKKAWNWGKYRGPVFQAKRPKAYEHIKTRIVDLIDKIGMNLEIARLNSKLSWWLD